jgi:hypothetical protein
MYKILTASDGTKFKLDPSAYAIVAYKQISGRDLFADIQRSFGNGEPDVALLLDILFVFCYCHDNKLDYATFFKKLPVKIAVDTTLHEKLIEILIAEFGIEKPEEETVEPSGK